MTKSSTKKLLASAAVTALLFCSPVVSGAHALGTKGENIWHGLYLGQHTGYGWTETDLSYSAPLAVAPALTAHNASLDYNSLAGGVTTGLNHQIGALVIGAEADLTFMTSKDSVDLVLNPPAPTTQTWRESVDFVGTIRGRVGLAFTGIANIQSVIYFTGGYAYGQIDHEVDFRGLSNAHSQDDGAAESGYALGGGIEGHVYKLLGVIPITAKVEYMYIDLDDSTISTPANAAFAASTTNFDNEIHQVRMGINVQLGGMPH